MTALISIIVPCYKQAHFLQECIESVKAQSFAYWECIIVNDCSPDNTEDMAKGLAATDPRIRLLSNVENLGLAGSRNAAMAVAVGTYILPLDADDKIAPRYLELAMQEFNQFPDTKLLYCNAVFFGDKQGEWPLPPYTYSTLFSRNVIFCSAVFRKNDAEQVGGFRPSFGFEDWDLWLRIIHEKDRVTRLEYPGFFYRQLQGSMITTLRDDSQRYKTARKEMLLRHADKFFDWTEDALYYALESAQNFAEREKRIDKHPIAKWMYHLTKQMSKC